MPIPKKFPTETERQRLTTLGKYELLHENDQESVLGLHDVIKDQFNDPSKVIYIAHALPSRISEFYSDLVAGDADKTVISADEANDEFVQKSVYENDLKEKVSDWADSQSEFGFFVLIEYINEDGVLVIQEVPQDQYFPQDDGSVIFATYKKDPGDFEGKRLLLLCTHYFLEGKDCVIERTAHTTDDQGVADGPYDFQKMAELVGQPDLKERDVIVGLNDLPIRQVDNGKRNKWGFGKSDYADILPQLSEINERSTQFAIQFLKNLDAKMKLPEGMIEKDGTVKPWEVIGMSKDDAEPGYIVNTNTLMADAREHILNETKTISFITAVPMFELLKSAMPERVESLRIQLFGAIRKAGKKRAKIKRALLDMFRIGFRMAGIQFDGDITIKFSDVLPVDELIQAETENTKVIGGLSSKLSAIQRINGYTEEEAQEEMDRIEEENKMAGFDNSVPPVLDNSANENL